MRAQLLKLEGGSALLATADQSYGRLHERYHEEVDVLIADQRYTWIHTLVGQVMQNTGATVTSSDRIDRIVTHRLLGVPIFLAVMWVVFKVTADVSAPLLDRVDGAIGGPITRWVTALLMRSG